MNNKRNEQELTERLYETDGFISDFEARVILCNRVEYDKNGKDNIYGLVLDRTAFFPEGGGQQSDEGTIDGFKVIDVQIDEEGKIVHFVETDKAFKAGQMVSGSVDYDIRFPRMQNHSAEHIVSGLVHSRFGYDNVGFHMSEKTVRFDFNGPLTKEQMDEIEREANDFIYKNIPIEILFPTAEEISDIEYRSKLDITEGVRLVVIEGADVCACCAPHVDSTGQIGIIKIIDVMPHRQGTRVTMVAGRNALDDYIMLHDNNGRSMAILSSKRENTADFTQNLLDRNTRLKEENTNLRKEITGFVSRDILERIKNRRIDDKSPEVIFSDLLDNVGMRNLINAATEIYDGAIAGFIGSDTEGYRYIIACKNKDENDIRALATALNDAFDGKGGGSPLMVQGSLRGEQGKIKKLINSFDR